MVATINQHIVVATTLFMLMNVSITEEKCKEQVLKHNDIAFLLSQLNFGQGRVNIIHHVQVICRRESMVK